jgi:hypothetical protein
MSYINNLFSAVTFTPEHCISQHNTTQHLFLPQGQLSNTSLLLSQPVTSQAEVQMRSEDCEAGPDFPSSPHIPPLLPRSTTSDFHQLLFTLKYNNIFHTCM